MPRKKKKKKFTPEELEKLRLYYEEIAKKEGVGISRALTIKGWMFHEELIWLAKTARRLHRIIEVGSYMGRSTIAMLDNSEAHLWCVDSWNCAYTTAPAIRKGFLENIQNQKDRVTVLQMRSNIAAELLMNFYGPNSFDMVFIDGGHGYEVVKADILDYTPLVRTGGIISGHDYSPINRGVMIAVDEMLEEFEVIKTLWWKVKS